MDRSRWVALRARNSLDLEETEATLFSAQADFNPDTGNYVYRAPVATPGDGGYSRRQGFGALVL